MTEDIHYSIRELSEITGVNAVTLRAWERRYGLLKPNRTSKGHRFYTADHLDTVRKTLLWLDRGVAISKVRPLLDNEDLLPDAGSDIAAHWQELLTQTLLIVEKFQQPRLEKLFDELFSMYPLDTLASNYFPAVMDALNRKLHLQFGGAAEQLFFISELHSELLSRIRHANANNHGHTLLLVELDPRKLPVSSLLVGLALLESGYRLQMLLDACPLREIPYIVEKSGVCAVICHSDSKPPVLQLEQEICRAADHAHVPFFLSGEWLEILPALSALQHVFALPAGLRDTRQAVQLQLAQQSTPANPAQDISV